ncbi:MAG: hypothetical protein ACI9DE_001605, partial [Halioglobus sp.]
MFEAFVLSVRCVVVGWSRLAVSGQLSMASEG